MKKVLDYVRPIGLTNVKVCVMTIWWSHQIVIAIIG